MLGVFRHSNFILVCGVVILLLNGIWEFLGFPTFSLKGLFFLVIMSVTLISLGKNKLSMQIDHVLILSAITFLFFVATLFHSPLSVAVSYFQIFSPIIIFVLTISLFKTLDVSRTETLFLYFVLLQFIAALVKLFFVGQAEGRGIGTLSIQAGSISTFIVFFTCLIALRYQSLKKKRLVYFLLFAALAFSIINEKRLGLLVVAFMSFIIIMRGSQIKLRVDGTSLLVNGSFVKILPASIFALFVLVVGANFVPTLTEEFSLWQLAQRISTYLLQINSDGVPVGRLSGMLSIFARLSDENSWIFGLSPVEFMSSKLVATQAEISPFRLTGFTLIIARTGLLGLFIYTIFFWSLLQISALNMTGRLFVLYILFDFIIYSDTLFVSHGVIFLLCLMLTKDRRKIQTSDSTPLLT